MSKEINVYTVSQLEYMIFSNFFCGLRNICETEKDKRTYNLVVRRYMNRKKRMERNNIHEIVSFIRGFENWSMKLLGTIWNESVKKTRCSLTKMNNTRQTSRCIICTDKNIEVYFSHGSSLHSCLCADCAYTLICNTPNARCPMCREQIERVIAIPNDKMECVCGKNCTNMLILGSEYLLETSGCNVPSSMKDCENRYVVFN